MREFAKKFYKGKTWQTCRNAYFKKVGGLCEDCLERGLYVPAEEVHHIIPLTPENITDSEISLSFSNLRALCRECHLKAHRATKEKDGQRFKVDAFGRVSPL